MLDRKGNRITYFGHSTFSLATASGHVALIDPWVMTNPRCPDALKKVPKLDVIFLSHAHSDHLGDLLALAKQHKPQIVAIFETCLWLQSKGFEHETKPMGKGGTQKVADFEVTMTHAFHSNSIDDNGVKINAGEPAGGTGVSAGLSAVSRAAGREPLRVPPGHAHRRAVALGV